MIRNVDIRCTGCGSERENRLLAEDAIVYCEECGCQVEQVWWKRPRGPAQWGDNEAVMVHVNAAGDVRYPGRHDAKVKDGYERVYLRSLADVNKFERQHKVMCHTMHYDNNGRALDDRMVK